MQSPSPKTPLPLDVERALLEVLSDQSNSALTFYQICNSKRDENGDPVFGQPGTKLRQRVQKRRDYLLKNPTKLTTALYDQLANQSPSPSTSPEQTKQVKTPRLSHRSPAMGTVSDLAAQEKELASDYLYFDMPWECPNQMVVLKVPNVKVDGTLVDKVRIKLALRNIKDREFIDARLSSNGQGIVITEASTTWKLGDRKNVNRMTELIDLMKNKDGTVLSGKICEKTKEVYETVTTAMQEDSELKTRKVLYRFPDGISCNNTYFNNDQQGRPPRDMYFLRMKFVIDMEEVGKTTKADGSEAQLVDLCGTCIWEMVIDTPEDVARRRRTDAQKVVPADDLDGALANLGLNFG